MIRSIMNRFPVRVAAILSNMSEDATDSLQQMPPIARQKAVLRKKQRAQSRAMQAATLQTQSAKLIEHLNEHPVFRAAQSIFAYMPMPDEPDLTPLLRQLLEEKKCVCLPRFCGASQTYHPAVIRDFETDLVRAQYDILEPGKSCRKIPPSHMDLTLVPGLAFDRQGWRLGRGKGFYDRMLVDLGGVRFGIAFDFQWMDVIPRETLDQKMDWIITPNGAVKAERV